MLRRIAILDENNSVTNVVFDESEVPQGSNYVRVPANQLCEIGFTYTGQTFTDTSGKENFKMAVIDQNGLVINMIVGNENSPTENGTSLVKVSENQVCGIGFTFNGVKFLDPDGVEQLYS